MKKTYNNPKIEVVKIATTHMIAFSANMDKNQSIINSDDFGAHADDADWEDYE